MATSVRTITVAVDGSPAATNAARWACGLARSTGGELHLIHVVSTDEVAPWPAIQRREKPRGDAPSSTPAIEAARRVVEEEAPEVAVSHLVLQGPIGATIVEAARGADLLVIGRKGRRRPGWLRPGSTSHGVADGAESPVVLVPGPSGKAAR